MTCDHRIGLNDDYEGETIVYHTSDIGDIRYIEEIFKFCPDCGEAITITKGDIEAAYDAVDRTAEQSFLTPNIITRETLKVLQSHLNFSRSQIVKQLTTQYCKDTITIRKPNRYVIGEES